MPKEAVMHRIYLLLILPLFFQVHLFAFSVEDLFEYMTDTTTQSFSEEKPCALPIGDTHEDNDKNEVHYYRFDTLVDAPISFHLKEHDPICHHHRKKIRLFRRLEDGRCESEHPLEEVETESKEFSWSPKIEKMHNYCFSVDSECDYDVALESSAPLAIAINDASATENEGSMSFIVTLTKVSSSDTKLHYTFEDGSARNGINYTAQEGDLIIPAGELTATIPVTLIDTGMQTTKEFFIHLEDQTATETTDDENHDDTETTHEDDDTHDDEETTHDEEDTHDDDEEDGTQIVSDLTAKGTIYGSATLTTTQADGPDICYESKKRSGLCFFGNCFKHKEETQLRAMVDGLSDIKLTKALTHGVSFINLNASIGVHGSQKTLQAGDDEAEERTFDEHDFQGYFNASLFPKGFVYRLGEGASATRGGHMDKDDRDSYYDESMFSLGLFTQYTPLISYEKDGKSYQEVLQACDPDSYGALSIEPLISGCGLFSEALNSHTAIILNNTKTNAIGSSRIILPPFRHSKQYRHTEKLRYGMVLAQQHMDQLETSHDEETPEDEVRRDFIFSAPFSPTYKGRVMFIHSIQDNDAHANEYRYVFEEGDYWIENWNIDKASSITIETHGRVRIFVQNDLTIKTAGNLVIGSLESDAQKFYLYCYGGIRLEAADIEIQNGYLYAQREMHLYTHRLRLHKGALTASETLQIETQEDPLLEYEADENRADQYLFEKCQDAIYTEYQRGPFDAWDSFHQTQTVAAPLDRNISTKIANREFGLIIASLDASRQNLETKEGIDIEYRLYDFASQQAVTNWLAFSPATAATILPRFTIKEAYRDIRVQFKFCSTTANGYTELLPLNRCLEEDGLDLNTTTFSSDNFAIRPKNLTIAPQSDPIYAGKKALLAIIAQDDTANPTANYNPTQQTYPLQRILTKYMPDDTINNALAGETTLYSYSFEDGNATDVTLSYDDIGKVKISFEDQEWSRVDADDTAANCQNDDDSIGRYSCGERIFYFIPDHFALLSPTIHNHQSGSFTYLSNDLNLSAVLSVRVEAQNAQNQITKNFDKGSWEQWINASIVVDTPHKDLLQQSGIDHTTIGFEDGVATIAWDDANNSKNIRFNFKRQKNQPLNPFAIEGEKLQLKVETSYATGFDLNATTTATQKATFLYGRTHASRQRFSGNKGVANIYFESYCFGDSCDKTLLPDGINSKHSDDLRWYINTKHTPQDGSVGTLYERGAVHIPSQSGDTIYISNQTTTNPVEATIHYSGVYGYPYRTTVENNASSWLLFNEDDPTAATNSFSVEYNNYDSHWNGVHETETRTNDYNISQTNRRIMW